MKTRATLLTAIVVFGLGGLVGFNLGHYSGAKSERQAWRQAASPVFASRGTYNIADHATASDLRNYLDPHQAVVWQEHSTESNPPTDPYSIMVVTRDLKDLYYGERPNDSNGAVLLQYGMHFVTPAGEDLQLIEAQHDSRTSGSDPHLYRLYNRAGQVVLNITTPGR